MSATKLCIQLSLCFLIMANIECAVIKMQEIPVNEDFFMKIVLKEDPETKERAATIKITIDTNKHHHEKPAPPLQASLDEENINHHKESPAPLSLDSLFVKPLDEEKKHRHEKPALPLASLFVKPTGDFTPGLDDRISISGNGGCAVGEVRRGPKCTKA